MSAKAWIDGGRYTAGSWDFCPKKTRPKGSRNGNKVMALMTGHKINMASHNKARGNKAASLNGSFHLLKSHKV
jgi:hypothetical protein